MHVVVKKLRKTYRLFKNMKAFKVNLWVAVYLIFNRDTLLFRIITLVINCLNHLTEAYNQKATLMMGTRAFNLRFSPQFCISSPSLSPVYMHHSCHINLTHCITGAQLVDEGAWKHNIRMALPPTRNTGDAAQFKYVFYGNRCTSAGVSSLTTSPSHYDGAGEAVITKIHCPWCPPWKYV